MTTLTIAIVVVFVIGYAFIALESFTRVNKAAIALLMFVATWTLFMFDPGSYLPNFTPDMVNGVLEKHLGSTATTLFFLMGAMTIVEVVDQNGGFNFVRDILRTTNKRKLLWRIAFMTFFLSAILDNMTTSIVMVMVLRKLVDDHHDRLMFASLVIIAANSGGAFSPIGDVTTIMLWNKGLITAGGTKHQKNASEWRKTSEAVEYRNGAQATYAKEENHLALKACEHMILHIRGGGGGIKMALEHPLHNKCRYHH